MPAYVIYHVPSGRGEARVARENLAAKVGALASADRLQLDGMWIVQRDGTSDQIRDELRTSVGPDDGLLVFEIGQDAAWAGVSAAVGEWLLERLSAWEPSETARKTGGAPSHRGGSRRGRDPR
jgi:hypothetical protein